MADCRGHYKQGQHLLDCTYRSVHRTFTILMSTCSLTAPTSHFPSQNKTNTVKGPVLICNNYFHLMFLHKSLIVTMNVRNFSVQPANSRSTTHDGNIKVLKGEAAWQMMTVWRINGCVKTSSADQQAAHFVSYSAAVVVRSKHIFRVTDIFPVVFAVRYFQTKDLLLT